MAKITAIQWIGLVPFVILIALLFILWIITGLNSAIFYILSLVILTGMYISTHLFFYNLFEYGEKNLSNSKELLTLEKEEALNWWMYISGAGFTFLIGGLPEFENKPLVALIGLAFLILGNLVYNVFYYPRYRLLVRKCLVGIELSKKQK